MLGKVCVECDAIRGLKQIQRSRDHTIEEIIVFRDKCQAMRRFVDNRVSDLILALKLCFPNICVHIFDNNIID